MTRGSCSQQGRVARSISGTLLRDASSMSFRTKARRSSTIFKSPRTENMSQHLRRLVSSTYIDSTRQRTASTRIYSKKCRILLPQSTRSPSMDLRRSSSLPPDGRRTRSDSFTCLRKQSSKTGQISRHSSSSSQPLPSRQTASTWPSATTQVLLTSTTSSTTVEKWKRQARLHDRSINHSRHLLSRFLFIITFLERLLKNIHKLLQG